MPTLPRNFVIAPDKFKGSLTAVQVAESLADGIERRLPGSRITRIPMADGGDGTLAAMLDSGFAPRVVEAAGPNGVPHQATYGWRETEGCTQAFIELASICGLAQLGIGWRDPYVASSLGVGEAMRHAGEAGVDEIVLALGGSASIDGGLGVLVGLGFQVLDEGGRPVAPNLRGLLRAREVVPANVLPVPRGPVVLVDVSNPLCGTDGAARVYGPQKGLHETELDLVDQALRDWGELLERTFGVSILEMPGVGAAGGVPAALVAALGARLVSGAEWLADQRDLEQAIMAGDIIITGEGSFDVQSMMGKAPGLVIDLSRRHGKQVVVVAGSVDSQLAKELGVVAVSTSELAGGTARSFAEPSTWVARAAESAVETLLKYSDTERNLG